MERGAGAEYAPRGSAFLLKYVPRESASFLNYRLPPSAGCPPTQRGLGTQTHKNTHKGVVCRCARCAQMCAFFGAKTHVVRGREVREIKEDREFREDKEIKEREKEGKPPPPQRGLGAEYVPREGASFLKYAPREGVGGGSATSLLNYRHHRRTPALLKCRLHSAG